MKDYEQSEAKTLSVTKELLELQSALSELGISHQPGVCYSLDDEWYTQYDIGVLGNHALPAGKAVRRAIVIAAGAQDVSARLAKLSDIGVQNIFIWMPGAEHTAQHVAEQINDAFNAEAVGKKVETMMIGHKFFMDMMNAYNEFLPFYKAPKRLGSAS